MLIGPTDFSHSNSWHGKDGCSRLRYQGHPHQCCLPRVCIASVVGLDIAYSNRFIDTPLMTPSARELLKPQVDKTPMARLAYAQEVADAVVYLASDRSSYITGTVLAVRYFSYPPIHCNICFAMLAYFGSAYKFIKVDGGYSAQ